MSNPLITINLVVYNGEKYIRQCLDSVLAQSYPCELIEINILDNASTDSTLDQLGTVLGTPVHNESTEHYDTMIYHSVLELSDNIRLLKSKKNWGMWPAQEELLKYSKGERVVVLSVDVILDADFIKNAIEVMERDSRIGALQAKVYKYGLASLRTYDLTHLPTNVIDTLGFQIFRSRRIVNIGHGEIDGGRYDSPPNSPKESFRDPTGQAKFQIPCLAGRQANSIEIFAVEGAVPVFRRQALEDCRLKSQTTRGPTSGTSSRSDLGSGAIVDPDFFWYGDDLDLAWRMRMFGWKQVYAPNVIAWHDRKTTKALAGDWREFIKIRKTVPMFKRRLDWRNTTLTIIKNDFAINWLRDLPFILWRQLRLWAYFLIFEPTMFLEIFNVAKMLPKMLKRRSEIMQRAKVSPKEFRKWIV